MFNNQLNKKYLDQWEQAVIAAWANSARIEQTAPGTYAARLPNNRLVGEYNQDQGGWVESPGSADMDEQAVAEGRDATDAEHKKAMDTLFKRPDVVAMAKSLKRRDQDPEYDAKQKQEFQKRLSKKRGVAEETGDEKFDTMLGNIVKDTPTDFVLSDPVSGVLFKRGFKTKEQAEAYNQKKEKGYYSVCSYQWWRDEIEPAIPDFYRKKGVAEGSLNEWQDPGAPCAHCRLPHGQHRVQFNRKNPNVSYMNQDDEWNDVEMGNAEDHDYTPSKGYRPLSQREAELVGFDNLNVDIPNNIYDRINNVRQRIARVGKGAGNLTRVKEQGVAEEIGRAHV